MLNFKIHLFTPSILGILVGRLDRGEGVSVWDRKHNPPYSPQKFVLMTVNSQNNDLATAYRTPHPHPHPHPE